MADAAVLNSDMQKKREFSRSTLELRNQAGASLQASSEQEAPALSELPPALGGYAEEQQAQRELAALQFADSSQKQNEPNDDAATKAASTVQSAENLMRLARTLRTARLVSLASLWGIIVYIALLHYQFINGNILKGLIVPTPPISAIEVGIVLLLDIILLVALLSLITLGMMLSNPCVAASTNNSAVLSPILKLLCSGTPTP